MFAFDHVLYMNKLLEGRRDMVGIHDSDCPVPTLADIYIWHTTHQLSPFLGANLWRLDSPE